MGEGKVIPFYERPVEDFDATTRAGLRDYFMMCHLVAPHMVKAKNGLIMNLSTPGAGISYCFNVPYGLQKAAVERMTADVATELWQKGVNVICCAPTACNTDVTSWPA